MCTTCLTKDGYSCREKVVSRDEQSMERQIDHKFFILSQIVNLGLAVSHADFEKLLHGLEMQLSVGPLPTTAGPGWGPSISLKPLHFYLSVCMC